MSKLKTPAKILFASFLLVFSLSAFITAPALATDNGLEQGMTDLGNIGTTIGQTAGPTTLTTQIGNVIKIILGVLGIILLGLIIYAGILWMTSAGDEEKIEQAKKILINAIIGLVILVAAYALTWFIMNKVGTITGTITE